MADPLNVLIIEDSEDDAMLLVNELRRGGYEPVFERVETAEAMVSSLKRKQWDIIISDYAMPGFIGLDALGLLKESGMDIPFIIVSGTIGEDTAVEAMLAGAHDYIMKDRLKRLTPAIQRELREAKMRLRHKLVEEERARLSMAVEQAGETIIITDVKGTITYVNPTFKRITGFSREEAIGQTPHILKSGKHDRAFYEDLWNTVTSGKVWTGHFINKKKNGELYEEDATISPIIDSSGKIVAYVAVMRDVSNDVQLRRQLLQAQKMEAVGILAGGIAHDFNNLLTTIQGFTDLAMVRLNEDDLIYKDLKKVKHASVRAADLTRQLLIFGRKQPMELTLIDLNATINGLVKMLNRLIGEDIAVKTDLASDACIVKADEGNIEQVIMNLVVNARDAMPDGGELTIKTESVTLGEEYCRAVSYARPGRFIRLSISDTGLGIEDKLLRHIFEPFFTTKDIGKGTGLGLAVVYGIVKQHEGWINVHSAQGQGTTFRIYLPARQGKVQSRVKETVASYDLHGDGERILLVEDEEGVREVENEILCKNGYTVFKAANVKEAIEIFEKEKGDFHMVFSDVILPDNTGLQLIDRLLSLKPGLKVLLCSGYTDDKSQWPIIREKGYHYLQKPYALPDLLKMIKEILTGRTE